MNKVIAGIVVCAALTTGPVLAQTQAPAKDRDQMICKQEKKVNSRFTTRTCHTRAQWDEIAEINKRNYAEQRDRPSIVPPSPQ